MKQHIKAEASLLLRLGDCIDRVGHVKLITEMDLLKTYYTIPLTEKAKKHNGDLHPS